MIPNNNVNLKNGIKKISYPSHTYKLDFERERMIHYADGLAAMEQFVYKVLQTDRYHHVIYNWNYGIELDDLFGKPTVYVKAELPRRITEALIYDDRVTGVEDFSFPKPADSAVSSRRTTICVKFTVRTIFGNLSITKDVTI